MLVMAVSIILFHTGMVLVSTTPSLDAISKPSEEL